MVYVPFVKASSHVVPTNNKKFNAIKFPESKFEEQPDHLGLLLD